MSQQVAAAAAAGRRQVEAGSSRAGEAGRQAGTHLALQLHLAVTQAARLLKVLGAAAGQGRAGGARHRDQTDDTTSLSRDKYNTIHAPVMGALAAAASLKRMRV